MYIYIYIYVYTYILNIYIYIYIHSISSASSRTKVGRSSACARGFFAPGGKVEDRLPILPAES